MNLNRCFNSYFLRVELLQDLLIPGVSSEIFLRRTARASIWASLSEVGALQRSFTGSRRGMGE